MNWIQDEDWTLVEHIPELELVNLAAELGIIAPAQIEARALWNRCVQGIVDRGRAEGLPFSKYDAEDLAELSPEHLAAIADIQGTAAAVAAIIRVGAKVYRLYERQRPNNPIPLHLPSLLIPVARAASVK
jgi:predicted component of type VI protein secretion system